MSIQGYKASEFTHEGVTHTVYRRGQGPAVVVITEVPGIHDAVIAFADLVAEAGFTAVLPDLFGVPGKPVTGGYVGSTMLKLCVSKEFKLLAGHESSPITEWLRALARALHAELGGKGVGAVGMCLTGNFALSMAVEPALMAPVMSQPALPLPVGKARAEALAVSPDELAAVKRRIESDGLKVLGLCFTHDPKVPRARWDALRRELKDGFEGIEIDSSPGNKHGIKQSAHSVLTLDLVRETGHPTEAALQRTLGFLRERLL